MAEVEALREKFREEAEFVIVYIKEAHPGDEWQLDSNTEGDVVYNQPNSFEARVDLAKTEIGARDSVGFRSAVMAPPDQAHEVNLRLVPRLNGPAGPS